MVSELVYPKRLLQIRQRSQGTLDTTNFQPGSIRLYRWIVQWSSLAFMSTAY